MDIPISQRRCDTDPHAPLFNQKNHKHQCAVRQMLQYRERWGLAQFQEYIKKPSVYGLWAGLMDDFAKQWNLGNRGQKGNWIE